GEIARGRVGPATAPQTGPHHLSPAYHRYRLRRNRLRPRTAKAKIAPSQKPMQASQTSRVPTRAYHRISILFMRSEDRRGGKDLRLGFGVPTGLATIHPELGEC